MLQPIPEDAPARLVSGNVYGTLYDKNNGPEPFNSLNVEVKPIVITE